MRPAAAVLLLLAACASAGPAEEEGWVTRQLRDGPPSRDLVRACQVAFVRAEFPPGEADPATGRIESGWLVELAPYSRNGRRSRAEVRIQELPGPGGYELKVRVVVEGNQEVHKPLDAAEAEWEFRGFSVERAREVLQHILLQVGGGSQAPAGGPR